jgi:hypothetical protein
MDSRRTGNSFSNQEGDVDAAGRSEASALFLAKSVRRPLLPWEKEIIDILGISEAEFQAFSDNNRRLSRIRPAEYAHIPDINNGPVAISIAVSLAIGAITTAVSYLLAPKPPTLEDNRGGTRTLAGRVGAERFASTFGFESAQELAKYSDSIPIIWTHYTGTTGGVLVSPKLVWSRIKARGGQQTAKLLYVVGESSVSAPDRAGIFIGNNSLNGLNSHEFAFWWNTSGEPTRSNLLYGTQKRVDRGDPDTSDYLFDIGLAEGSFSGAYLPSNNLAFGLFNAIPNGTPYRTNWRVISIPSTLEGDADNQLKWERRKIAGPERGNPGMYGEGCGWARRQGLIAGNDLSEGKGVAASVGDRVNFIITSQRMSTAKLGDNVGDKFSLSDIDNTLDSECIKSDDILRNGETIQIGQTLWKVTSRELATWDKDKTQWIALECIEILGSNLVGIPPRVNIDSVNPVEEDRILLQNQAFRAAVPFYPLCKTSLGLIKNTRPCDSTEVSIKSQVWTRLNGICNFQTIPRPSELIRFDEDNVSITSGTQQLYDFRTSVFTVHYREVGEDDWIATEAYFCVRGSSPVDQYNLLRFRHPKTAAYEYRFIPVASPTANDFADSFQYVWLNGSSTNVVGRSATGGLLIEAPGREIGVRFTEMLDTMRKDATAAVDGSGGAEGEKKVTGVKMAGWTNYQAYMYALLGRPRNVGATASAQIDLILTNLEPLDTTRIEVTGTAILFTKDNSIRWERPATVRVISSGYNKRHNVGGQAIHTLVADGNNPNGISGSVTITYETTSNSEFSPTGQDKPGREFEGNTQIAEISFYGDLITRSCDGGPEHQIVAVNEFVKTADGERPSYESITAAAVSIKSSQSFQNVDQMRVWIADGITSSNSFPKLVEYLLNGTAGNVSSSLIDTASIATADAFCQANGLFFDGAISDRVNLRSYLSDTAPYFLCNFVIKNGKFGVQPALPINIASFPIAQLFTANNILQDSLKVEFLPLDQRRASRVSVVYRQGKKNELPRASAVLLRYSDESSSLPIDNVDLSQFCTSRDHAIKAGKYLMTVRRRITRVISFNIAPEDAQIAPGALIKVALEQTAISDDSVGVIDATGKVTSSVPLADGSYTIVYYTAGAEDVKEETLTVSSNSTAQSALFGSLFALKSAALTTDTYMVERVELNEEGIVAVTAVNYPVDTMVSDVQDTTTILVEDI